ncbi:MAG: hypothetical protein AB8B86_16150 [Pseudomonadales bacterium]
MSLLEEIKQRKVFRVGAVYAVIAWGMLQVVDVISTPLNLPAWFSTVTILLLVIGFPIALIFSWIFDAGPDGVTKTVIEPTSAAKSRSGIEIALLLLLIVGIGWLILKDVGAPSKDQGMSGGTPVVLLMDTFAPKGVYDDETRRKSGTNADVLSEILEQLPVITSKEAIGSTWDREVQILRQKPNLILIHRSAFFHSMNQDLGLGYPADGEAYSEEFNRLYAIADNKLLAFMGFIAQANPNTQFILYSRGTGGGWPDTQYRNKWIASAQGRFPALTNRVTAIAVPGGTAAGSFRRSDAQQLIRKLVSDSLQLETKIVE